MEPVPGIPLSVKGLVDGELFKLLPVDKKKLEELVTQEKQALDELWNRHYETVKKHLGASIYARGSTLCPLEEPDKEHFLGMCMNEAYLAFLKRTVRNEYVNFGGFLYTLALHVALDVRKQITKRRSVVKEGNDPNQKKEPRSPVEMVPLDETEICVDEGRKPLEIVAAREVREVMRSVILEHIKSLRDVLSIKAVVYKRMRKWSWPRIADKLLSAEGSLFPAKRRVEAVKDLEKEDALDLARRLRERGVTDSRAFEV